MEELYKIIYAAAAAFAYLFIIAKLLGKKQIAQLDYIDYVVGISIGSIAAEMSAETELPIYYYIISMTIFFLLDLFVSLIGRKNVFLKTILKGRPLILINDGKVDYHEIKRSKLDINDIMGMARDKGFFDINDIAFALLETNGKISIMPKAHIKPVVAEDLDIQADAPHLTSFLVVDGKISKQTLIQMKKTERWLLDGLKIDDEKDLKNIFLATFNEKAQNFIVHYKNEGWADSTEQT